MGETNSPSVGYDISKTTNLNKYINNAQYITQINKTIYKYMK
jgi:hypothetical protein